MINTTVHLLPGQSVSLSTGKITNEEFAPAKSIRTLRREIVLRENDLLALHRIILDDQMIPSVHDLEVPGSIFHSENQGLTEWERDLIKFAEKY